MRNLFKKSLAFCLVAAVALTCFVGSFSVSAENPIATVSVIADTVEVGATSVPVTLTIESETGINEALIKVSSTIGTIEAETDVVLVTPADETADVEFAEDATDFGSFFLSARNVPDAEGNTVLGEVTYAEIQITFTNAEGVAAGDYTVDVEIPEGKVIAASKEEEVIDLAYETVTITVEEAVVECDHANATSEVTTQPTKDATGVMTYTCECGETWTEEIAKPIATTAVTFKGDIVVTSVVGNNITVSTKQMKTAYGNDATYFIVVDYKKYATGYVLQDEVMTLTPADRLEDASTANKDVISFTDIALYEMTLDFTMTAYFVNGEGVVVGYREFSNNVANMALAYANSYSTNTKLLTAFADMCAYGDAAQTYFANANPGTDICDATLPSEIFGETYMAYKSTTDGMPAAGEFNNDKGSTKIVSSTGFVSAGQTLKIDASNFISYTLRYDNYAWEDVEIKVHYEDSLKGYTEVVLTADQLIANGTAGNGQPKYLYYFKDLALYDCDKTVTMDMYYNGNLELTSVYSFGNYVNTYLSNAKFTDLLTTMELFSNSMGIQLGIDARW